ncbi:tubby-like F-box protein 14 isoform X2 [Phragmites australis]|uniref:tubby-like F-box protein 14 isoform X2 n=1 Tax=Phragmites australis TaxID=29695 RepID=UPI002D79B05E|nr:tubby-like F-box protein 14 isoform X2 [Phragmites australis]XP_062202148.1 tubby-like F-box protein 14 isoform X2 [Phragmites australis]
MSFRNIVRDVRDGFGSLSRRGFEVKLLDHRRGKSHGAVHELHDPAPVIQNSCWANLPPELLRDVIERLEDSEATWPHRKHVVACADVCQTWREMCKEIVKNPEFSGKITFPVSLKQPGPRDGTIQCFIKRDKSTQTYYLYLCLSSAVLVESGKFLLSAKRTSRPTCTEYTIFMNAHNISRSSKTYIGKLRSNLLGTKFAIYDTQLPCNAANVSQPGKTSRRFYSRKVSPKVPSSTCNIAQVSYELNVLGTRGPRRMNCVMHSIPASSLEAGGTVPCQLDSVLARSLDEPFGSISFSKSSIMDHSMQFSSTRFSDISMSSHRIRDMTLGDNDECKEMPLILRNKAPRWHEQLQCWCLNFRGRVTVASVKNFQLVAATQPTAQPTAGAPNPSQAAPALPPEHEKVILQFGKVAKDMFTMDYRYPLSAFQAFAICLSSFDTKLACE